MFDLGGPALAGAIVALTVAGFVKGFVGFGLPMVAMPLLSLNMPVAQAVATLVVALVTTNMWQVQSLGRFLGALRQHALLCATLVIGTVLGAWLLAEMPARTMNLILGSLVIVFSLASLFNPEVRTPEGLRTPLGGVVGTSAGVLAGMSAMAGPLLVIYLVSLHMARAEFVVTIGTCYLVSALALAPALGGFGVMGLADYVASAFAAVFVFAGMALGRRIGNFIDEALFRRLVLALLVLVGLNILARNI